MRVENRFLSSALQTLHHSPPEELSLNFSFFDARHWNGDELSEIVNVDEFQGYLKGICRKEKVFIIFKIYSAVGRLIALSGTIIVWVHRFSSLQFIVQLRKCFPSSGGRFWKKDFLYLMSVAMNILQAKLLSLFCHSCLPHFSFNGRRGKL